MKITQATIDRQWSRASAATRKAIVENSERIFAKYGITTPLRAAHFMAQISHECGGGTIIRESGNYSAKRIMQIFGVGKHSARVTQSEANALAGDGPALFDRVYGIGNPKKAKEFDNTRPGDGWRYRGNGMLQLTGRSNHRRIGKLVGFDLEGNPEMLENPATSFEVAAAEFKALNCLTAADVDDVSLVTRRVNGGQNGIDDRKVWLRRWKAMFNEADEPPQMPRGAEPQRKAAVRSTIVQGGTVATVAATAVAVKEATQAVTDAANTVAGSTEAQQSAAWSAINFVIGHPTLLLAVVAIVASLYVVYRRYRKLEDEGV